eukprot:TRINITY_DN3328_c0_g1_i2.p1 TRINITY_DN3328_c0_g1~~TRINITY_DN3328_c0_g1_i2.p1  ORF type:complete len:172 (+),score=2.63 TRINITY_DN3328_c0_g1_i2:92-607(+)
MDRVESGVSEAVNTFVAACLEAAGPVHDVIAATNAVLDRFAVVGESWQAFLSSGRIGDLTVNIEALYDSAYAASKLVESHEVPTGDVVSYLAGISVSVADMTKLIPLLHRPGSTSPSKVRTQPSSPPCQTRSPTRTDVFTHTDTHARTSARPPAHMHAQVHARTPKGCMAF